MSKRHKNKSNNISKDERKTLAHLHTAEMQQTYSREIADSIATAKIYRDGSMSTNKSATPKWGTTDVSVVAQDSVSAVFDAQSPKALLDFASFHSPGGGYMNGAWFAQEEMICGESNLYNILNEFRGKFYDKHHKNDFGGVYSSECIYVQDVVFVRDGIEDTSDVIVMAAPNAKRALKDGHVTEEDIEYALRERINAVMNIAVDNGIEELILGAFGCGVFANDPASVANMFKDWIDANPGFIRRIVFAIPNAKSENFKVFTEVFES